MQLMAKVRSSPCDVFLLCLLKEYVRSTSAAPSGGARDPALAAAFGAALAFTDAFGPAFPLALPLAVAGFNSFCKAL